MNWTRKIKVEVPEYNLPLFHDRCLKHLCKRRAHYFSILKHHMKEVYKKSMGI
jgi:hypothetical protein